MLTLSQQTQSPDVAPATAQATGRATVVMVGPDGQATTISVPRTREEIAALINQRERISDQLNNVSDRRHDLAMELQGQVDGVARKGLEDRIRVLDQRIIQLETDLATTGRQLSSAPPTMVATTEIGMAPPNTEDATYQGMVIGGLGMLGLSAIVFFMP